MSLFLPDYNYMYDLVVDLVVYITFFFMFA